MKYLFNTTILKKLCHILAILVICGALPLFIPQADAAKGGNSESKAEKAEAAAQAAAQASSDRDQQAGMDHALHGEHGYGLLNLN